MRRIRKLERKFSQEFQNNPLLRFIPNANHFDSFFVFLFHSVMMMIMRGGGGGEEGFCFVSYIFQIRIDLRVREKETDNL